MSNIIKPSKGGDRDEILSAKARSRQDDNRGFQAFDTLWQAGSGDIMSIAGLEARKEKLRKEAEELVHNAEMRAAQIEEDAYTSGFAKGQEEGRKIINGKMQYVEGVLAGIQDERKSLYRKYEGDLVELVKAMVEKVVNHEVSVNPRVIPACLRLALSYVVENSEVKVHLNGNDFNRIRELGLVNPELLEGFKQLELIEDESVSEGGCLLETEFGEVDATIGNRMGKLIEAIDRFFLQSLAV